MENICKICEWNVRIESGYKSYRDMPMKHGSETMEQYKELGVNPRDTDDPQHDDDSNVSYSFENTNFSINGISRFAAHNATMEIACDWLLYVYFVYSLLLAKSCLVSIVTKYFCYHKSCIVLILVMLGVKFLKK